eukprot:8469389-Ditylum_brightwellii.AAC.1
MLFGGAAELRIMMCPLLFTGKARKGHFILQGSQMIMARKSKKIQEEGGHPRLSPLQHPGQVKLSAGRFPYWTMVQ